MGRQAATVPTPRRATRRHAPVHEWQATRAALAHAVVEAGSRRQARARIDDPQHGPGLRYLGADARHSRGVWVPGTPCRLPPDSWTEPDSDSVFSRPRHPMSGSTPAGETDAYTKGTNLVSVLRGHRKEQKLKAANKEVSPWSQEDSEKLRGPLWSQTPWEIQKQT